MVASARVKKHRIRRSPPPDKRHDRGCNSAAQCGCGHGSWRRPRVSRRRHAMRLGWSVRVEVGELADGVDWHLSFAGRVRIFSTAAVPPSPPSTSPAEPTTTPMLRLLGRHGQLQSVNIWGVPGRALESRWRRACGRYHTDGLTTKNRYQDVLGGDLLPVRGNIACQGGDRDVCTGTTRTADLLGVAGCTSDLLRRSVTAGRACTGGQLRTGGQGRTVARCLNHRYPG
ncbi:MAG: hypothetical protein QOH09_268 [Pseudonocardiales bacterium]|nr:hypothetical protein [Pseudonocardiales bacterium]